MEDLGGLTASFWQQTLKSSIRCTGIGLHSGEKIAMELHPAAPNTGIVFRRTDVAAKECEVPARYDYVGGTNLCTTLVNGHGVRVATVEHLMAALAGCELDNVVIELTGAEVPIMDGSAEPFVFLIECAGVVEQDEPRRAIQVLNPVTVRDGDRVATLEPADGFSISLGIDFDSAAIGRQYLDLELSASTFKSGICRARTFGFLHEFKALQDAGYARGGSLENAIVVDGDEIMNDGGLRFDDEFVRHKILDCVGDLYLVGGPLLGRFSGVKAGHALHYKLLCALFAEDAAWTTVSMERSVPLGAAAWEPEAIAATG